MITSNPILGTGLHAIGGAWASTCYLPNTKIRQWSWGTFWIAQALFAWIILLILVGWFTVPDFFTILIQAPARPYTSAIRLHIHWLLAYQRFFGTLFINDIL